jgi:hypothetical protein
MTAHRVLIRLVNLYFSTETRLNYPSKTRRKRLPDSARGTTMSLSIAHSRVQVGVEAPAVIVEVHLADGLPSLTHGRSARGGD